jgi:DNA-binding GntR family transcriptional regulator
MANQKRIARTQNASPAKAMGGLSRSEFVYQQMLEAISEGRLRGEPIRESDIAKKLGVSRTPVRESLQRLQERGLLIAGGRSLVVATLGEREALELYAMREVLECTAARFAAERAGAEDIAILRRLHSAYMEARGDNRRVTQLNWRFHRAIHEAAHNRYLLQATNGVHDSLLLLHSTTFRKFVQTDLDDIQHRQIIEAIERRDPDAAETAAREHVRAAVRSHYETMVDDQPPRWANPWPPLLS